MYCAVPHSCCMWCHDDITFNECMKLENFIHSLQSILNWSGLFLANNFWPLLRTEGNIDVTVSVYWTGSQIVAILTADASSRWTAGCLSSASPESLRSVPTTNTTQQNSCRVLKISQHFSGLYLFSMFHSILCVVVSYLVENQNTQSVGPGIIAGLRAGRSASQWRPWNHNWRQQTSVTVVCVLVSLLE